MKFFFNNYKALKNGLYLDYFVKITSLQLYKLIIGKNLLYLLDKYIAEKFFYTFSNFFKYLLNIINIIKGLQFNQIMKLLIIITIQIILLIIL